MGYYDTYYRAEVREATRLTPNMVRVRFGGGDLAGWRSTGCPDERLVVVFPAPGDVAPPAPQQLPDGTFDYPEEATRPPMRSYTVREWDGRRHEVTIDFVAHPGGVAGPWAMAAEPGQLVYLTEAVGWYDPPADAEWELLVADMTALPALGRIVAQLPAGRRAFVIVETLEPEDLQPLPSAGLVEVHWLFGSGNGRTLSRLNDAVRSFDAPAGQGYVWFAGEAAESRAVRKHLRRDLGWPSETYEILGYWRVRSEEWLRRYEQVGPQLEHVYTEAVAEGQTSAVALELYDDALEEAGL